MYKQEKGITLIALIVTIIVLIILAAVTIVALAGDNNILSDAQVARCTNAYSSGEDQMKLSFMAIYSNIQTRTAFNSTYDARTEANAQALLELIQKDLKEGNFEFAAIKETDSTTTPATTTVTKIYIKYKDTALQKGLINKADGSTTEKPLQDSFVYGVIELDKQTAKFKYDVALDSGVSDSNFAKDYKIVTAP